MKNNSKKIRDKKQDIATAEKVGTNTRTGKMILWRMRVLKPCLVGNLR